MLTRLSGSFPALFLGHASAAAPQLADLRVQLRHLAIATVVPRQKRTENRRSMVEELLLPGIDLIRMDAVPGRQLRHSRLFAHRLQGNPRLECRIELPSRSAHHPLRLFRRNGTSLHLSRWVLESGTTSGAIFYNHKWRVQNGLL